VIRTSKRVWLVVAAVLIVTGTGVVAIAARSVDVDATRRSVGRVGGPVSSAADVPPTPGPAEGPAEGPACEYRTDAAGVGEQRLVPPPPQRAAHRGKVRATIATNLGPISVQLDADRAPCTVHSFVHLIREDYYTETACHRITTEGLWVLQCGDPTGTGTGTPGYRYNEENLPIGLAPAYRRGTLAMANAGPGTNGGQFFVVYRDSDIAPDYTVFGEVVSGLEVVERVAAAGTASGEPDGRPELDIEITEIALTG
jgi:peptidyl-prolyl cis-trans isomerase B (cyclophilin B)